MTPIIKYIALSVLLAQCVSLVSGHSYLTKPISRQIRCKTEQYRNVPGGNCFKAEYDANAYGINAGANAYKDVLAGKHDGRLCNGLKPLSGDGRHYEKFNTEIDNANYIDGSKQIEVTSTITAPHGGKVHYFLSKDGVYGKSGALSINDFEELPGCTFNVTGGMNYTTRCDVPKRSTGNHTLIYIYDASNTNELFSSCADIYFTNLPPGDGAIQSPTIEEPSPIVHPVDPEYCSQETVTHTLHDTITIPADQSTCSPPDPGSPAPGYDIDPCHAVECLEHACILEVSVGYATTYMCLYGINEVDCKKFRSSNHYSYIWCEK